MLGLTEMGEIKEQLAEEAAADAEAEMVAAQSSSAQGPQEVAEPKFSLTNLKRTRSPYCRTMGSASSYLMPLISAVKPCTSSISAFIMRISPHIIRSRNAAMKPFSPDSAKKSPTVCHTCSKGTHMRLLLVEDDRLLADGLTSQLERRDSAWIPPPPPEKRRRWPIEEHDLNEVLGNLLDNAGKWSARFVELGLQEDGKGFAITVEDDGPGIPPDALDTLGTRGLRLDEQTPGHGLGLAIVREIADRYGGILNFRSGSTGGFKATVHFPGTTGGIRQ